MEMEKDEDSHNFLQPITPYSSNDYPNIIIGNENFDNIPLNKEEEIEMSEMRTVKEIKFNKIKPSPKKPEELSRRMTLEDLQHLANDKPKKLEDLMEDIVDKDYFIDKSSLINILKYLSWWKYMMLFCNR